VLKNAGEEYIIRNFMIHNLHKMLWWSKQERWQTYSMQRNNDKC